MSSKQKILASAFTLIVAVAIAAIAFIGTGPTKPVILGLQNLPLVLPGFEPFPTPRNFDGPGTIIRVTPNGTMQYVTTLEIEVSEAGSEAILKANGTQAWGAEAGASGFWSEVTAGLDGASSSTYSFQVIGSRRFRVESEERLDAALKNIELNWTRQGRLFVIRETVAAKSMQVEFFDKVSGKLKSSFKDVSGQNFAVTSNNASLLVEFEEPANIFFSADELIKPTGLTSSELLRLNEVATPAWSIEERDNETITVFAFD